MKKFIAIFLAFVLAISMTACNNNPDVSETNGNTDASHSHDETTKETETTNPDDTTVSTDPSSNEGQTDPTEDTIPEETIVNHEHNYTTTVTNATCTEDGYTTYVCDCGDTYVADFVEATGHVFGDWVIVKAATEDSTGEAVRSCSACDYLETKDLPKLIAGHTHSYTSSVTKQPTCTTEGVRTYKCSCGNSYTESIAKTSHNYTSKVTKPTCTEKGYTTYTCSCGNSYKDNYVNETGHNYNHVVTKPTCTSKGYTAHTCKTCGYSYKDTAVAATGHSYTSKVTKEATCQSEGVKTFTCSCGYSYTESIAKTEHKYNDVVVKATCTTQGYTRHACTVCGYHYEDNYTDKTSHNYTSKITTAATCGKSGVKTYTCSCGASYTETIAATGNHTFGDWVTTKEPTTSATGTAQRTCSGCGKVETKTLDKLDNHTHSYTSEVTQEADCCWGRPEITTYTCSCGHSYTEETAPAPEHVWVRKSLDKAMEEAIAAGTRDNTYSNAQYTNADKFEDYSISICSVCHCIRTNDRMKYADCTWDLTPEEANEKFRVMINELRKEVLLGDRVNQYNYWCYDLKTDASILEIATTRAEQISKNFSHAGCQTDMECIASNNGVKGMFKAWLNSKSHYEIMINTSAKWMGFGYYNVWDPNGLPTVSYGALCMNDGK